MAKYDIDSQFLLDGAFTLQSDPPIQIAGRLKASSAGVTFERSAYLLEFKESFPTEIARYDVVQGVTLDGADCTLFDLFERPGTRIFVDSGQVLTTAEYVINACVMGLHLSGQKTKEIDAATLVFSGLAEWFRRGPDRKIEGDTVTIRHPIGSMQIAEWIVAPIAAKVALRLAFPSQHKPTEYSVTSTPIIVVKPDQPESLNWFTEIATRLENFFSLLLGSSTHLVSLQLAVGERLGYVVRRRAGEAQPINRQACLECTFDQIGNAIQRWFSLPLKFAAIENLVYGTIRNSSLFVETEFLSLAQAVESFHRVTNDRVLMDKIAFQEVCSVLGGLIDFFFVSEPPIRQRLRESISHADEPNFRARITGLLGTISRDNARALLGDLDAFAANLVDTRNYLTHPGISPRPTVLSDPLELYNMNCKLHAFLRLLVLIHIGFPEDLVFASVKKQLGSSLLE